MFFCRITKPFKEIERAFTALGEQSEILVVYEHSGEEVQTHVHFVISTSLSTDTIKNYFRRVTTCGKGNKFWSFKEAQDLNCITYMSKGHIDPVHTKGVPADEVAKLKSLWVANERSSKPDNDKPTQYKLALEVHETLHKLNRSVMEEYVDAMNQEIHTYEEYCKLAIKIHHKYNITFSFFSIDKVVHTAYTMRAEHRDTFVRKLADRFYK